MKIETTKIQFKCDGCGKKSDKLPESWREKTERNDFSTLLLCSHFCSQDCMKAYKYKIIDKEIEEFFAENKAEI